MSYEDIMDRKDDIVFLLEENGTVELEEGAMAVGIISGTVLGIIAGKAISKHYRKNQIHKVINNGTITKETITAGIKNCNNKTQLKQCKKMLEDIVSMYPKLEKNPSVLEKHMPLIKWIDGTCLTTIIPKKERELANK